MILISEVGFRISELSDFNIRFPKSEIPYPKLIELHIHFAVGMSFNRCTAAVYGAVYVAAFPLAGKAADGFRAINAVAA